MSNLKKNLVPAIAKTSPTLASLLSGTGSSRLVKGEVESLWTEVPRTYVVEVDWAWSYTFSDDCRQVVLLERAGTICVGEEGMTPDGKFCVV